MNDSCTMKTKIHLCHMINTNTSESHFELLQLSFLKSSLDLVGPNCYGWVHSNYISEIYKSLRERPRGNAGI